MRNRLQVANGCQDEITPPPISLKNRTFPIQKGGQTGHMGWRYNRQRLCDQGHQFSVQSTNKDRGV